MRKKNRKTILCRVTKSNVHSSIESLIARENKLITKKKNKQLEMFKLSSFAILYCISVSLLFFASISYRMHHLHLRLYLYAMHIYLIFLFVFTFNLFAFHKSAVYCNLSDYDRDRKSSFP